jgi:hypothetical protein
MLKSVFVSIGVLLLACSCSKTSDEEQVRAVIAAGEAAAEARDASDAMKLVADDYSDNNGLNKSQLEQYLRGYFLLHPKIELITRIGEIKFETANRARVQVEVTMVGTQRQGEGSSLAGDFDSLLIDLQRRDSKWLVTRVVRSRQ